MTGRLSRLLPDVLGPGGWRGNADEAAAYDAALREAFRASIVAPIVLDEAAGPALPPAADLDAAPPPLPRRPPAAPPPSATQAALPELAPAQSEQTSGPTAVVVEAGEAPSPAIAEPGAPTTPGPEEPAVPTLDADAPIPVAAVPAAEVPTAEVPTAAIPAAAVPAAPPIVPPSELLAGVPGRPGQRGAGTTAPDHLLQSPESLGLAADDFFLGLIRRTRGR